MDKLDLKWAEAVLTAIPRLNVAKPYVAVCCCPEPFMHEGVLYNSVDAGCCFHGIKSRWVAQPAAMVKAKRADGHRHTAYVQGGND